MELNSLFYKKEEEQSNGKNINVDFVLVCNEINDYFQDLMVLEKRGFTISPEKNKIKDKFVNKLKISSYAYLSIATTTSFFFNGNINFISYNLLNILSFGSIYYIFNKKNGISKELINNAQLKVCLLECNFRDEVFKNNLFINIEERFSNTIKEFKTLPNDFFKLEVKKYQITSQLKSQLYDKNDLNYKYIFNLFNELKNVYEEVQNLSKIDDLNQHMAKELYNYKKGH